MKAAATSVGLLALAGTIVPPAVFMVQSIAGEPGATPALSLDVVKTVMLVATVAWFAAAPFWMKVE
ncbi:MAG: hypothetical protein DWI27_08045 [Planctomycetota bacterium]|jgi:hypothetical protein|nr:MAG: hypothetical protein DWI27_08045 [Planctomycetota bacterium]